MFYVLTFLIIFCFFCYKCVRISFYYQSYPSCDKEILISFFIKNGIVCCIESNYKVKLVEKIKLIETKTIKYNYEEEENESEVKVLIEEGIVQNVWSNYYNDITIRLFDENQLIFEKTYEESCSLE